MLLMFENFQMVKITKTNTFNKVLFRTELFFHRK